MYLPDSNASILRGWLIETSADQQLTWNYPLYKIVSNLRGINDIERNFGQTYNRINIKIHVYQKIVWWMLQLKYTNQREIKKNREEKTDRQISLIGLQKTFKMLL